jgi:hypothetical protein
VARRSAVSQQFNKIVMTWRGEYSRLRYK